MARGSLRPSGDPSSRGTTADFAPRGGAHALPAALKPAWLGLSAIAGLSLATVIVFAVSGRGEARLVTPPAQVVADASRREDAALIEALRDRVAQLEAALAPLARAARDAGSAAAAAGAEAARAGSRTQELERRVAASGPQGDRFLAAALLLQASIATPRPWLREYQAMAELAPAGAIARPAAEVLVSHAARGVPTEAELRERFVALMPQLVARAPRDGDALDRGIAWLRGAASSIGLTAAPAPSDHEQAIAGVAQQLRRGNLAAAVGDAAALDAALQPLLAGWLAQARARLAVEQAVQETLLRILAPPAAPS